MVGVRRTTQYERIKKLEADIHEADVENLVLAGLVPTSEADLDDGLTRLIFLPPPAYREALKAYDVYGDALSEQENGRRYERMNPPTREDGEGCRSWEEQRSEFWGRLGYAVDDEKGGRHG